MTKEEILAKAKQDFPIGTIFKEATSDKIYTVESFDKGDTNGWNTTEHIIIYVEGIQGCGKYLYYKGKWAECISRPEVIINNYSIY